VRTTHHPDALKERVKRLRLPFRLAHRQSLQGCVADRFGVCAGAEAVVLEDRRLRVESAHGVDDLGRPRVGDNAQQHPAGYGGTRVGEYGARIGALLQ